MESRIANILNRMNEENRKLNDLRRNYAACEKMRKASNITISANVAINNFNDIFGISRETIRVQLDNELKTKVLDLLETYFEELGRQSNDNLESMVEEMKQEQ